jgi:hypothetical protein
VTENGQHAPLTWREPAKTSKLLLAGNAATHPQNVKKILFCNINFLHVKTRKLKYLNDLSKSVSNQNLNNIMIETEMEKLMKFLISNEGRFLLESIPTTLLR